MLLTYERVLLAHFITQSDMERARILQEAIMEPKTSGPLIMAYKWAIGNT